MTQEVNNNDQNTPDQPPLGILSDDWVKTPDSVKNLVTSLLQAKQEQEIESKSYTPTWPSSFMLFANLLIVIVLALLLAERAVLRCIFPPEVTVLSAAIILPVVFHIIWRNIYHALIPQNYRGTLRETIKIGFITVPLTYLITFFNEIQPWKLSSRLLSFLLLALAALAAFLNVSPYSVFYVENEPSLQGFSIERLDTPPQRLGIDQPLTIDPGEKVFVEAILLGGAEATCTWSTLTGNEIEQKDCSTVFASIPGVQRDVLTLTVHPACGSREETVSLPIFVQQ